MTMNYAINFTGYWREPNVGGMPSSSGIYGVYACTYTAYSNSVSLQRLLYIGEAADIHARIANHEGWGEWRRQVGSGEVLCVSAALISGQANRQHAEAALIFTHKPPCNTEYKDNFPFDTVTISTTGSNALMKSIVTAHRTEYPTVAAFARRW
jgi:hypothetical protein